MEERSGICADRGEYYRGEGDVDGEVGLHLASIKRLAHFIRQGSPFVYDQLVEIELARSRAVRYPYSVLVELNTETMFLENSIVHCADARISRHRPRV